MNQESSLHVSALLSATAAGDFERLRSLVANGAEVNGCNEYGSTVLAEDISASDCYDRSLRVT